MAGPPNAPPADLTEAVTAIRRYADSTLARPRDGWELLRHLFSAEFVTKFRLPEAKAWLPREQRQEQRPLRTNQDRRAVKPYDRRPQQRYQRGQPEELLPTKLLLAPEDQVRYEASLKVLS